MTTENKPNLGWVQDDRDIEARQRLMKKDSLTDILQKMASAKLEDSLGPNHLALCLKQMAREALDVHQAEAKCRTCGHAAHHGSSCVNVAPPSAPSPTVAAQDQWRDQLAALIDIYDDGQLPFDSRCYVDGAFTQQLAEARALLADTPSTKASPTVAGMTDSQRGAIRVAIDVCNRSDCLPIVAEELKDILESIPRQAEQNVEDVRNAFNAWRSRHREFSVEGVWQAACEWQRNSAAVSKMLREIDSATPSDSAETRDWRIEVGGPSGYVRFETFQGETLDDALDNAVAQNFYPAQDEDGWTRIEVKV